MGGLLQDVHYGLRMLGKAKTFTAIAILTLALGIGANVAIFSFADELWLRPMPVRYAARVMRIFTSNPSSGGEIERGYTSYPDFENLRRDAKSFSGIASLERRGALLDDGSQTHLVTAAVVSDNFFDVLQPEGVFGRAFTEAEARQPKALSIAISYPFWQRQFHRDRSLVGRTIVLDRQQVAVMGILPRGFRGTEAMQVPDVWIPLSTWLKLVGDRERVERRDFRDYELFGRLRDGATLERANGELAGIAAGLAQSFPASNQNRKMTAVPEPRTRGESTERVGGILLAVAALALLIASANVASLLLARAESRRKEIATRVALGAARSRILRQLFTETAVLAIAGTVAALVVAKCLLDLLPALMPQTNVPAGVDAFLSWRGLWFGFGAGLVSLFFFGLVPAWQTSSIAPASVLKQQGPDAGSSRPFTRSALVVAQVALSMVMVIGSGLLVRSVLHALGSDPGFNAHQQMLVLELVPSLGNKSDAENKRFTEEAQRRIEALPGVTGTTVGMRVPFGMSGSGSSHKVFVPGTLAVDQREGVTINFDPVADRFFDLLGTRLLRGRAINARDVDSGARVMVVNQQMASRFWPHGDAIGQRVRLDRADGADYEIVGIAEDGKYADFSEDSQPYFYIPMREDDYSELAMAIKARGDAALLATPVRQTLRGLNPGVPTLEMLTLREHVRESLYDQRLMAKLIAGLGGLGLLLAGVGIYGLMAFLVRRRTHEIGIRLALGAPRGRVFRMVLRQAGALTMVGVGCGIVASLGATRALSSLLLGVGPTDALVVGTAIFVLLGMALVAAMVPAVSASKVDPMVALRYE